MPKRKGRIAVRTQPAGIGGRESGHIIGDAALLSAFSPLNDYKDIALAVSGGPDSMALLHLAVRWTRLTRRPAPTLHVVTVDHGLRPESKSEAAFVCAQAQRHGLPHHVLRWEGEKPKTGIQAAARKARYDLMAAYCRAERIGCLVAAHTADDQAETFVMRLRRGSGLDGLSSMAVSSVRGGLPLLRPLLWFSKARLMAYLRRNGLAFVTDPANDNATFERVRVRRAMATLAAAGIARSAIVLSVSRLGRAREALTEAAEQFVEHNFRVTPLGAGTMGYATFARLPPELALRVLSKVLPLISGKTEAPRLAKAERFLANIRAGARNAVLSGCIVMRKGSALVFYREPGRTSLRPQLLGPGETMVWDGRFVLTLAAGFQSALTVAPLGSEGLEALRHRFNLQPHKRRLDRLASITTPGLWQGETLLAAPILDGANGGSHTDISHCATASLSPRLSNFAKPVERN
jgi:tRNA(Ile)-lysidine synthase